MTVRFNTIYNSSQNVSLSRDTTGVVLERNILVKARESNITAFKLYGSDNVALQNVGDAAPSFLVRTGSPGSLLDGGGNLRSEAPALRLDRLLGLSPGPLQDLRSPELWIAGSSLRGI